MRISRHLCWVVLANYWLLLTYVDSYDLTAVGPTIRLGFALITFLVRAKTVFKKVIFERGFNIQNGTAIPEYMESTIDARVIGKVELTIHYSKFSQNACGDTEQAQSAAVSGSAK